MKTFLKGFLLGFIMNICVSFYIFVFWEEEKKYARSNKNMAKFITGCFIGALVEIAIIITLAITIKLNS